IMLSGTSSQIVNQTSGNGLANFATNAATGSFTINSGRNFTTAGNFTNNGTLTVGGGSKFDVNGSLTNFNSTSGTLTGGTYNVTGTLQFNGANIKTNAANITLTGTSSQIVNQTGVNGLSNFATNASSGSFTLAGNRNLTAAGSFSNAGTLKISKGSTFTVGAKGNYTQTKGQMTVDGTLALTSSGAITISGGSVFGNGGTFSGSLTSSGTLNIGDALKQAGKEAITQDYTQTLAGLMNVDIGGTTVGAQYDQLDITDVASLNGILNLDLINNFVPTIGEQFDILNFGAKSGTFSTVHGTGINNNEHFQVVYNASNVTLDVVAGAAALSMSGSSPSPSPTPEPSTLLLLGCGLVGMGGLMRQGFKRNRKREV
ncbi:MAG: PEP-CTERM sorting domain-containing protein, partial [Terriglobia bacterium]